MAALSKIIHGWLTHERSAATAHASREMPVSHAIVLFVKRVGCSNLVVFENRLIQGFHHSEFNHALPSGRTTTGSRACEGHSARGLPNVAQGVASYAHSFRILSAKSGWHRLNRQTRYEIYSCNCATRGTTDLHFGLEGVF